MKRILLVVLVLVCRFSAAQSVHVNSAWQAQKLRQYISLYQRKIGLPWYTFNEDLRLSVGSKGAEVYQLAQDLKVVGDLPADYSAEDSLFTPPLAKALRKFQSRHGLPADGVTDKPTIQALNVSPASRLALIRLNLQRWQSLALQEKTFLFINIPEYYLYYRDTLGKDVKLKVIVGRPEFPTPQMTGGMDKVIFNPEWAVPYGIARKEVLPLLKSDPDYLRRNKMGLFRIELPLTQIADDTIDWVSIREEDFNFRLVQAPGKDNALGKVKFTFLNEHDVYLHDTPDKSLFSSYHRAFSHGCIRVAEPLKLARAILGKNYPTSGELAKDNEIITYGLPGPVPLYISYFTCWADDKGELHFAEDIYKLDHPENYAEVERLN